MRSMLLAAGVALAAPPQDWPGFRGPERNGRVESWPQSPAEWPETLSRKWRVRVGLGHASPVSGGASVIVFTREGDEEVLRALDPANGEDIWRSAYPAPFPMHRAALDHGPGPKGTPEIADGRVFTLGISGILSAWDLADGSLLWRRGGGEWPLYGAGASPLALPGGGVIAHLGGPGRGVVAALDAASGETVWEFGDDGPAYVSPVLAELAGVPTLLTMTEARIVLLDPDDGRPRWERPFTTPYDQNIVTPLVLPGNGTVVFAGLGNPTFAVRFRRADGGLAGETVWEAPESPFYMSNPVLAGERLVGFSERNSGQFVALDPATGESLWRSPPRAGENAALLVSGRAVLALTEGAELLVLDPAAPSFEPLQRYQVAPTPTWAHPLPLPGGVLIKDEEHLTRWSFRSAP